MGDIDALRKREIPYVAIVDGQGVSIGGTSTLDVLLRRGMESGCQVDASGVAADASTLRQLQARGIQNFCEVTENGIDPVSSATLQQIAARGIYPRCPVDANGVALTGTSTIDTLLKRGISYFCPLDENGTATTLSSIPGWVLSGATIDMDFANSRYFGDTLVNLLSVSRASTGYAQTVAGTLTSFVANTPRITDLGLLIEEARTNLCLRSQTFNIATWTGGSSGVTLADNQTTAPDGTSTSGLSTDTTANSTHFLSEGSLTYTSGTAVTLSVYVKAGTARYIFMRGDNNAGSQTWVTLDTQTGTILTTGSPASPFVTSLGNGWFRFGMTNTPNASFGGSIVIGVGQTSNVSSLVTYVGTSQSYYVWGAQFEVGAFATSYIPTTTVSVTRAADNITAGGNLLTMLESAAVSLVAKISSFSQTGVATLLQDATNTHPMLNYTATPRGNTSWEAAGTALTETTSTVSRTALSKAGMAGSAAGRSLVVNNATTVTDANAIQALSAVNIGATATQTNALDGYLSRLSVWNTKLADATLKAFTV